MMNKKELTFNLEGISLEDYMQSKYKDIQSDKALDSIAKIEDGWRKQNLAEDYYNEKRTKVTLVTKNS